MVSTTQEWLSIGPRLFQLWCSMEFLNTIADIFALGCQQGGCKQKTALIQSLGIGRVVCMVVNFSLNTFGSLPKCRPWIHIPLLNTTERFGEAPPISCIQNETFQTWADMVLGYVFIYSLRNTYSECISNWTRSHKPYDCKSLQSDDVVEEGCLTAAPGQRSSVLPPVSYKGGSPLGINKHFPFNNCAQFHDSMTQTYNTA